MIKIAETLEISMILVWNSFYPGQSIPINVQVKNPGQKAIEFPVSMLGYSTEFQIRKKEHPNEVWTVSQSQAIQSRSGDDPPPQDLQKREIEAGGYFEWTEDLAGYLSSPLAVGNYQIQVSWSLEGNKLQSKWMDVNIISLPHCVFAHAYSSNVRRWQAVLGLQDFNGKPLVLLKTTFGSDPNTNSFVTERDDLPASPFTSATVILRDRDNETEDRSESFALATEKQWIVIPVDGLSLGVIGPWEHGFSKPKLLSPSLLLPGDKYFTVWQEEQAKGFRFHFMQSTENDPPLIQTLDPGGDVQGLGVLTWSKESGKSNPHLSWARHKGTETEIYYSNHNDKGWQNPRLIGKTIYSNFHLEWIHLDPAQNNSRTLALLAWKTSEKFMELSLLNPDINQVTTSRRLPIPEGAQLGRVCIVPSSHGPTVMAQFGTTIAMFEEGSSNPWRVMVHESQEIWDIRAEKVNQPHSALWLHWLGPSGLKSMKLR